MSRLIITFTPSVSLTVNTESPFPSHCLRARRASSAHHHSHPMPRRRHGTFLTHTHPRIRRARRPCHRRRRRQESLPTNQPQLEMGDAAYRAIIPTDVLLNDPDLCPLVETPEMVGWMGPGRHIMAYSIVRHAYLHLSIPTQHVFSLSNDASHLAC